MPHPSASSISCGLTGHHVCTLFPFGLKNADNNQTQYVIESVVSHRLDPDKKRKARMQIEVKVCHAQRDRIQVIDLAYP